MSGIVTLQRLVGLFVSITTLVRLPTWLATVGHTVWIFTLVVSPTLAGPDEPARPSTPAKATATNPVLKPSVKPGANPPARPAAEPAADPKAQPSVDPPTNPPEDPNADPAAPAPVNSTDQPADTERLPWRSEMTLPTVAEILRGRPADWIVLKTLEVVVIEPIEPRPDTLKLREAEIKRVEKLKFEDISSADKRAKLAELHQLAIVLLGSGIEDPEYTIDIRYIDRIEYFETLALERVSQLLDAGELSPAYEVLMFLDRRHRNWPGWSSQYHRYLLLDAARILQAGQAEPALVMLERLFALDRLQPRLSEVLGAAAHTLMQRAWDGDDPRQVRHFLARLMRCYQEHPVAVDWQQRLQSQAAALLQQADQTIAAHPGSSTAAAAATQLADRAAVFWPQLNGLKDRHRVLTEQAPVLRAGVWQLPPTVPSIHPDGHPAGRRHEQLCHVSCFSPEALVDGRVRYESTLCSDWEPEDLGRRIRLTLRDRLPPGESRPLLRTTDVLATLRPRFAAESGDDRWRQRVVRVSAASPFEWTLQLQQIPLRVEPLLSMPMQLARPAAEAGCRPSVDQSPQSLRFVLEQRSPQQAVYRRSWESGGLPGPYLAELIEQRYADWDSTLQGFLRGEVDCLPEVEWKDVRGLQADNRFFVQPQALPETHLLQWNPRSVWAQKAPLRRALLHALPREDLLKQVVLQNADPQLGRLTLGPFAQSLAASPPRLTAPAYQPTLAASLAAVAKKELNGEPLTLRLLVPADAAALRVAPHLVEAWRRIGITVVLVFDHSDSEPATSEPASPPLAVTEVTVPRSPSVRLVSATEGEPTGPVAAGTLPSPSNDVSYDLVYRVLRIVEPVEEIAPLLACGRGTDPAELESIPQWSRTQLADLERAVDWTSAQTQLHQLQAQFLAEARWIPLWELDRHVAFRRRLANLPARLMHPYHHADRWIVRAWYSTETP
jgi:hypothetical protein